MRPCAPAVLQRLADYPLGDVGNGGDEKRGRKLHTNSQWELYVAPQKLARCMPHAYLMFMSAPLRRKS